MSVHHPYTTSRRRAARRRPGARLRFTGREARTVPANSPDPIARRAGPLLDLPDFINAVGIDDLPEPGWARVRPAQPYNSVTEIVTESFLTNTDFPAAHDSHERSANILVDADSSEVPTPAATCDAPLSMVNDPHLRTRKSPAAWNRTHCGTPALTQQCRLRVRRSFQSGNCRFASRRQLTRFHLMDTFPRVSSKTPGILGRMRGLYDSHHTPVFLPLQYCAVISRRSKSTSLNAKLKECSQATANR
jgi:hypothetical protein